MNESNFVSSHSTSRFELPRLILASVLLLPAVAFPQTPAYKDSAADARAAWKTQTSLFGVKNGLFVIVGKGGNSVLRLTGNGLILVDGNYPTDYEALETRAQKTAFGELPIRALILTDYHEAHSGNNAQFLGDKTQIFAHENVAGHLEKLKAGGKPIPSPTVTYTKDHIIRLGGVEVDLKHFGPARTNGDTIVFFPGHAVVALGDLYSDKPDPDYAAGGSLLNWPTVLDEVLKLDFDTAVPGRGRAVSRAEVQALDEKLSRMIISARADVVAGSTRMQIGEKLRSGAFGIDLDLSPAQLEGFYAELKEAAVGYRKDQGTLPREPR
ncbi:MAG: MBL fold metallo-hydrolase [Acidobacteriota bacterium]|nr:MBL fold metallo-hydrolase [Acidobacteriota bacterium]